VSYERYRDDEDFKTARLMPTKVCIPDIIIYFYTEQINLSSVS